MEGDWHQTLIRRSVLYTVARMLRFSTITLWAAGNRKGGYNVFDLLAADRWRPNAPLIGVLLSLSLFLVACTSTIATLHGPVLLNYQIAPTARAHLWRVTAVWPASFAWDAGLRPGTLLHGNAPPATQGVTTVKAWMGHSWRRVNLPPPGDTAP